MPSVYSQNYTHLPLVAEAYQGTGLIFATTGGDTVCHIAGLPAGVAEATADAFNAAMSAEPEPLDPETIAARQDNYRRDMIDAGRGHLIGGAA